MRVRMNRTTVIPVPDDPKSGLPRPKVKKKVTLTVGCGYELPNDIAKQLIDDGLAFKVTPKGEPKAEAKRGTRGAA